VAVIPVADTPDDALTGRKGSAASAEASPALIEAMAEALCSCSKIGNLTIEMSDLTAEDQEFTRDLARAAYAALVEHLGLEWEYIPEDYWFEGSSASRRLVSKWVEVQP
jgi:hypothetical protein